MGNAGSCCAAEDRSAPPEAPFQPIVDPEMTVEDKTAVLAGALQESEKQMKQKNRKAQKKKDRDNQEQNDGLSATEPSESEREILQEVDEKNGSGAACSAAKAGQAVDGANGGGVGSSPDNDGQKKDALLAQVTGLKSSGESSLPKNGKAESEDKGGEESQQKGKMQKMQVPTITVITAENVPPSPRVKFDEPPTASRSPMWLTRSGSGLPKDSGWKKTDADGTVSCAAMFWTDFDFSNVDEDVMDEVTGGLEEHKVDKVMDDSTRASVKKSIKKDRLCSQLQDGEIDGLLDAMRFYKFEADQQVLVQGEYGEHFFAVGKGNLRVIMDEKVVNTLHAGDTFGGFSLVYKCPITANITPLDAVELWGVAGKTFVKALMENAETRITQRREALGSVKLFARLDKEKDLIAGALFEEVVEAGSRVVTEGETATGMYLLKSGALSVLKGATINDEGAVVGGTPLRTLGPGDHFGEKAILSHEAPFRTATVVATETSRLYCIGGKEVESALGTDLQTCLDLNINRDCILKSPMLSGLTRMQQRSIVQAMVPLEVKPNEVLDVEEFVFLTVIDGEVSLLDEEETLERTMSATRPRTMTTLVQKDKNEEEEEEEEAQVGRVRARTEGATAADVASPKLSLGQFREMDWARSLPGSCKVEGGFEGARLGKITGDSLLSALRHLGIENIEMPDMAIEFLPNLALTSKIPIFRNLSQRQLGMVVLAMKLETHVKGDVVLKAGDLGTSMFIVHKGALNVLGDNGVVVNTLGKHDFFGERGFIMGVPHTVTIDVASETAQLFRIESSECFELMSERVKEDLKRRIELEDTTIELSSLRHIKVIGHGDFGVVRLVECMPTGVLYSLKRLSKMDGTLPKDAAREAKTLEDIAHPFVMHVVKNFETPKSIYVLAEVINGGSFRKAFVGSNGVLSQKEAQFYFGCIVLVLGVMAEHNILHRDLKPENVMLDDQGYPKLINFTHAKKLRFAASRSFTLFGTPQYMAPEVIKGRGYSVEVDLWSVGIMMYEVMCGKLPYGDDSVDPTATWAEIVKGDLSFPNGFACEPAKSLIQGLLTSDPRRRLGGGARRIEDVKCQDFFRLAGKGENALFDKLMGREIEAPLKQADSLSDGMATLSPMALSRRKSNLPGSEAEENEDEVFSDAEDLFKS